MLKKIFLLAMILLIAVAVGGCISQTPEEADWNRAQENFTINALEEFLTAYPNGTYAAEAKANIKSLKKAEKPYQFIERIKGELISIDLGRRKFTVTNEFSRSMEFHTNKNTSITSYNISAPSDMEYLRNASNDTKRIKRVENRSLETLNSGEILDIEYINISNHYFAKTVTILVGYRFCECVSPGGHHSLVFDPKNPKTS